MRHGDRRNCFHYGGSLPGRRALGQTREILTHCRAWYDEKSFARGAERRGATLTQLRRAEAAVLAAALKTMPGLSSSLRCLSKCTCNPIS